jgi:phospholipid/cholesterol/gamma-HCH transport system permease protein
MGVDKAAQGEETDALSGHGWTAYVNSANAVLTLQGDWLVSKGNLNRSEPGLLRAYEGLRSISFDARRLGHWDSALLVFLSELRKASTRNKIIFDDKGLPSTTRRLLDLLPAEGPAAPPAAHRESVALRVGLQTLGFWTELTAVTTLVGETTLRTAAALRGGARMRAKDVLTCVQEAGLEALPIVTIVNVLVGAILAFVGAIELRRFGADIYIANLVAVAVLREMAALMTAIVMSGRTGAAYAAQIATMQGSEEIDALRSFGIPVLDYLILPRVLALTSMMPILYLYGSAVGILGGFAVAVAMLNISPTLFITQAAGAVSMTEVFFGLGKSIAFGALIAMAGCRVGMRAGRSAADVGRAATTAVVVGIVGVIALDAIFAVCANTLGF